MIIAVVGVHGKSAPYRIRLTVFLERWVFSRKRDARRVYSALE